MAITLMGTYLRGVNFDGTSTTFSVDFHDSIQADNTLHNKNPVGIFSVLNVGGNPTFSLNGTVVTFAWATPQPSGAQSLQITFLFPGT